jgi:hypothetical protein
MPVPAPVMATTWPATERDGCDGSISAYEALRHVLTGIGKSPAMLVGFRNFPRVAAETSCRSRVYIHSVVDVGEMQRILKIHHHHHHH